jgi:hypothetical protein
MQPADEIRGAIYTTPNLIPAIERHIDREQFDFRLGEIG